MPEPQNPPLPVDDLARALTLTRQEDASLLHLGVAGDTYTLLVRGADTGGRFCVIEMYVPPGGGPPPHRHDFDETFILLEGEIEATFRGEKTVVSAGSTVNIPSNAPHRFHNVSSSPARMLCVCSPAGLDDFFQEIGTPVASRTAPAPKLTEAQQAAFIQKAVALGPKYRTEMVKPI